MLGKILGGYVGHRAGQRAGGGGLKGALLGAGVGAIARRGLGPLGLVLAGGWAAKKLIDRRRAGRTGRRAG